MGGLGGLMTPSGHGEGKPRGQKNRAQARPPSLGASPRCLGAAAASQGRGLWGGDTVGADAGSAGLQVGWRVDPCLGRAGEGSSPLRPPRAVARGQRGQGGGGASASCDPC